MEALKKNNLPEKPVQPIQFIDLKAQQALIKDKIEARIAKVLEHGAYIMGPEITELETKLSEFCGAKYSISCSSGTDALILPLAAQEIGVGDAVFCPSFTFAATAEVVALLGATPVFVDVLPDTFNIDVESLKQAIIVAKQNGLKPKAVIPVDLFGQPADYDAVQEIADENGLWVLSDSAQGFGSTYNGRNSGTIGLASATSFFPAKPLGCYGDGGAVFTDNEELAQKMESLRVHGKGEDKYDNARIGMNARLDTIQAAILLEKLAIFPDEIKSRDKVAARYNEALSGAAQTPLVMENATSVWAQYTLKINAEKRAEVMAKLKEQGVPSVVYYPKSLHQQTAYAKFPRATESLKTCEALSQQVFSLPMHPYLDEATQDYIIQAVISAIRS
ncbi:MAG: aminotransferase DegT [Alphaproteobacteria bacterium CG11_big_fil_rev_8_21_14_0_20_44_7]|nr:MAG: aminotransferase DegT [Alphaproteobacteria bacterium CG11_big_fil_rev_8_21_14_0_20_44_7]